MEYEELTEKIIGCAFRVYNVKGGAKVRRVAGRTKSAAPSERLAENVCRMAASVAARMDIRQEAPRCTATWINGLTFVAAFWSKV